MPPGVPDRPSLGGTDHEGASRRRRAARLGGGDLELDDVRVTAIEELPSGLAVPAGASEVARVAYEGEWEVVDDDAT